MQFSAYSGLGWVHASPSTVFPFICKLIPASQWQTCQIYAWIRSSFALAEFGKLGYSFTTHWRWFLVRPHVQTSTNHSRLTLVNLTHPRVHSSCPGIVDVFVFAIILYIAKRSRGRYPGIPSILDHILRDATHYFLLIFTAQLAALLFLYIAPVGGTLYFLGLLVTHRVCMSRWISSSCPGCKSPHPPPLQQRLTWICYL